MTLIRPEARAALWRWRDVIAGGVVLALTLPTVLDGYGNRRIFAAFLAVVGLALVVQGIRRARFPVEQGGPGVVEIDERQITYLGPLGGGAISLDDLSRLVIHRDQGGARWQFTTLGGERLSIPTNAAGAEAMFDALSVLPGADHEAVRRSAVPGAEGTFLVWTRQKPIH